MSGKIKIGVMGAHRGMVMIRLLLKHPEAELVAICDFSKPLLDKCRITADEAGVNISIYESFDEFLNHDMDAVVLANYANEHAPYAIRCLKSGRHVLSEVLPVQTFKEAVELVEAVEESGLIYSYAENYSYFRSTMEMKLRYHRGDIGEFTHGEGEYVHDCTSIWPSITYGDPNHWRNLMYSTYYCTHSIGPIITITGVKPKRIVGFETLVSPKLRSYGAKGSAGGMIVMQMENGATVKSLHGIGMRREPSSVWYSVYGQKGMMESDRWGGRTNNLNVYIEGEQSCKGILQTYEPHRYINNALSIASSGHSGGDYYTVHFFIEKILGRPDGEHIIDVYTALDMGLPGILAYRSILQGNMPIEYPDFRKKGIRDHYRSDTACVDPKVAGEMLIPSNAQGLTDDIAAETYAKVKDMWENGIPG